MLDCRGQPKPITWFANDRECVEFPGTRATIPEAVPLWKAQQRLAWHSLWYWQMVPASPLELFSEHWPQTHS